MVLRAMTRRLVPTVAVLAAVATGATLLVAPPVPAAPAPPPSFTAACTSAPEGHGGFTDVVGQVHRSAIECMAYGGVALGLGDGRFAPQAPVTRGQMATFVARTIDLVNRLERSPIPDLPASGPTRFTDLAGHTHEPSVHRLAVAGIVDGRTATTFAPDEAVTRGQMATFINNMQRFLAGGVAFTSDQDHFVDDTGNVHEANINALATAGLAQGVTATHYAPQSPVQRGQMATFLARYLGLAHTVGAISTIEPVIGNATIAFRPTARSRVIAAEEPDVADDTVYVASGLGTGTYRVTLVQAELVAVDVGELYRFVPEASAGVADEGTVAASITAINGIGVSAGRSQGAIRAIDGEIRVTIDADRRGNQYPVIHPDGPGSSGRLDLDAQGRPTGDFGVAGFLETLPVAAPSGPLASGGLVTWVDKDADLLVVDAGGTERTYRYDGNDAFYLDSVASSNQLTLTTFEERLSRGDRLGATTLYAASPAQASTFVLEDISPLPPTPRLSSVGERNAVVTIDDLLEGATANVYLGPDNATFAQASRAASSAVDANPAEPGFQVELSDLQPGTSYEYYVTQTQDGDESLPHLAQPRACPPVPHPTLDPQGRRCTELVTVATSSPQVVAAEVPGGRPGATVQLRFSKPVDLLGPPDAAVDRVEVACRTERTTYLVPGLNLIPIATETVVTYEGRGRGQSSTAVGDETINVVLTPANPSASQIPADGSDCRLTLQQGFVRDADGVPNSTQIGIEVR